MTASLPMLRRMASAASLMEPGEGRAVVGALFAADAPKPPVPPPGFEQKARELIDKATAADVQPMRTAAESLLQIEDETAFRLAAKTLYANLGALLPRQPRAVRAWQEVLGAVSVQGLISGTR